jgi:tRNA-dihydrouridine synthase
MQNKTAEAQIDRHIPPHRFSVAPMLDWTDNIYFVFYFNDMN